MGFSLAEADAADMSQLILTCPRCTAPLVSRVPDAQKGDAARDEHLHIEFRVDATCINGHRWVSSVNITLYRGGA